MRIKSTQKRFFSHLLYEMSLKRYTHAFGQPCVWWGCVAHTSTQRTFSTPYMFFPVFIILKQDRNFGPKLPPSFLRSKWAQKSWEYRTWFIRGTTAVKSKWKMMAFTLKALTIFCQSPLFCIFAKKWIQMCGLLERYLAAAIKADPRRAFLGGQQGWKSSQQNGPNVRRLFKMAFNGF